MCCYTRTLKTLLHRLCPSAPKQGWVFCAEAHLKVLPWVGPLSLSLSFPPLPKPTVPPSAHQQRGHCLRLVICPSWEAGELDGHVRGEHQCPPLAPRAVLFFIFALQKAPRPYETWPKHVGYWLEKSTIRECQRPGEWVQIGLLQFGGEGKTRGTPFCNDHTVLNWDLSLHEAKPPWKWLTRCCDYHLGNRKEPWLQCTCEAVHLVACPSCWGHRKDKDIIKIPIPFHWESKASECQIGLFFTF